MDALRDFANSSLGGTCALWIIIRCVAMMILGSPSREAEGEVVRNKCSCVDILQSLLVQALYVLTMLLLY
jgi:hypothetical protein